MTKVIVWSSTKHHSEEPVKQETYTRQQLADIRASENNEHADNKYDKVLTGTSLKVTKVNDHIADRVWQLNNLGWIVKGFTVERKPNANSILTIIATNERLGTELSEPYVGDFQVNNAIETLTKLGYGEI